MATLKGTKTHEALKEAFAGESMANRRYLYFARKAELEGYPGVKELFEDTAKGARNSWYVGMMDTCVNLARARGINVLMTLWLTPSWARGPGTNDRVPPSNPQDYSDFARWAADHWRGRANLCAGLFQPNTCAGSWPRL